MEDFVLKIGMDHLENKDSIRLPNMWGEKGCFEPRRARGTVYHLMLRTEYQMSIRWSWMTEQRFSQVRSLRSL